MSSPSTAASPDTNSSPSNTNPSESLATRSERTHLNAVLKEFSSVMVATYDRSGKHPRINVRPMHVAKLDDDGTLTFVAARDTLDLTEDHPLDGNVIGQGVLRQFSMFGQFTVSNDRVRLAEIWSKAFNIWFPKGKDDANACVLTFTPRDAELWDASGLKGLKYLFESARALVTKTTPDISPDLHATLKMNRA